MDLYNQKEVKDIDMTKYILNIANNIDFFQSKLDEIKVRFSILTDSDIKQISLLAGTIREDTETLQRLKRYEK